MTVTPIIRIRRPLSVLLLLALGGHLLNWLPISLGYGLDLLTGQIFVYLALLLLGPLWAVGVAVISLIPTYWHWGTPWPALIIVVEVLLVGLVYRRRPDIPLPLLIVLFWASAGIIAAVLLLDGLVLLLMVVKQAINGVLAAAVAGVALFLLLPWVRPIRRLHIPRRTSATQLLSNLLLVLFLVPISVLIATNGKQMRELTWNTLSHNLEHSLDMLEHHIQMQVETERPTLRALAEQLAQESSLPPTFIRQGNASGHRIGLVYCDASQVSEPVQTPALEEQEMTQRRETLCASARVAHSGQILQLDPATQQYQLVIWAAGSRADLRNPLIFSITPARDVLDAARASLPIDILAAGLLQAGSGKRLVQSVPSSGISGASPWPESLWHDIATVDQTLYRWPVDSPSPVALHRWSDVSLWRAIDSHTLPGTVVIAGMSATDIIANYRTQMLAQLALAGLLIATGLVMIQGIAIAFRRSLQPHMDTLLRFDARQPIPRIPSRFMEMEILNRRLQRMSSKIQRTTAQAERNAKRLSQLVQNAPLLVWAGTFQSPTRIQVTFVSSNLTQLTGCAQIADSDEWIAQVVDEDRALLKAAIERLHAEGYAAVEYRLKMPDGRHISLYSEASCLHPDQDGDQEMIGLTMDISKIKATHEQVARNARMGTLGEMATGIAHELNQPLQVIQLAADNAREDIERSPLAREMVDILNRLERIVHQAQRAAAIINNMRLFGRSQNDGLRPVELRSVVDTILNLMGQQIRSRGIQIDVEHAATDCRVLAGGADLEQTVANLLTNARDAIEARRKTALESGARSDLGRIRIRTGADAATGTAFLHIEDNGGGIAEAHMEHVFEPFFTTKTEMRSTGLGLTVSYGIVNDLGGHLRLENTGTGIKASMELKCQATATDPSSPPTHHA